MHSLIQDLLTLNTNTNTLEVVLRFLHIAAVKCNRVRHQEEDAKTLKNKLVKELVWHKVNTAESIHFWGDSEVRFLHIAQIEVPPKNHATALIWADVISYFRPWFKANAL